MFDSLKINFVHGYSMTLFPFWLEWAGVRLVGDHQMEKLWADKGYNYGVLQRQALVLW